MNFFRTNCILKCRTEVVKKCRRWWCSP